MPDLGHYHQRHQWVGDGIGTTFVLITSSAMISLLKNVIPSQVRIPCYTVIIATFVTVDMVWQPMLEIHQVLGLFIPLIVVNCHSRSGEAYANKAPVPWPSPIPQE